MIRSLIATASGTSPALYGIEIEEPICNGYNEQTIPTAVVTVAASGAPVVSGGVTLQRFVFAVTVTYQPCGMSSETKVKTYAEDVTIALPGAPGTITPTVGAVTVVPVKVCGGRARGVRVLTSLSVVYAA